MPSNDNHLLTNIKAELDRIQTVAGTLETIETEHFRKLTNRGDDALNQIAVEEQSAARQLGEVKQLCLSIRQKVDDLVNNGNKAH